MCISADGLKSVPVGTYTEIEARIEEGTRNRTVASTKMNATSRYVLMRPFTSFSRGLI